MSYHLDLLGLAHPKFKLAASQLPQGCVIGVFDDPFGPVLPKLRKLLLSGKIIAVRIQAHWDNNHRIVSLEKLGKKLPKYEKLAKDFPEIDIYVSHSCEYDESSQAKVRERCDMIRRLAPSCIPVNSCMKGATLPDVITERHGDVSLGAGSIASTDGVNSYDIDADEYNKNNAKARFAFHWGYRCNLREINDPGQKVPTPDKRTADPSPTYIESLVRLCEAKPVPPSADFPVKPFNSPNIYKTHAEDDQEENPMEPDDPRENRPVLIIKQQVDKVKIITWKGQEVGSLSYGGVFNGGRHRYYSGARGGIGIYGFQIADKAQRLSGSPYVYFKAGKTVLGPVHPTFRAGVFR